MKANTLSLALLRICAHALSLILLTPLFLIFATMRTKVSIADAIMLSVGVQMFGVCWSLARRRRAVAFWVVGTFSTFAVVALALDEVEAYFLLLYAMIVSLAAAWPVRALSDADSDTYHRTLTKLIASVTILVAVFSGPLALALVDSTLGLVMFLLYWALQLAAAASTLVGRKSSYTLWLGALAGALLSMALSLYVGDNAGVVLTTWSPGWVGALLAALGALKIDMQHRPGRALVGGALALATATAAVLLFAQDFRDLRDGLRRARYGEECERSGDANACGYWALYTYSMAERPAELWLATQRLEQICSDGIGRGCFQAAFRRYSLHDLFGDVLPLGKEARRRAIAACDDGAEAGCAVAAMQHEANAIELSRQGCAANDPMSCWESFIRSSGSSDAQLCELGFNARCSPACSQGAWDECANTYEMKSWNRLMYGVRVEADGLEAACGAGDGEACYALGLNATADVNPYEEPVPVRSLDVTWGRACEVGFDIACAQYANRLLDRPLGEQRDVAKARQLLDTACDRGDATACWTAELAFGDAPSNDRLDELMPMARASCEQLGVGCHDYVWLRAAELDVMPYPFSFPYAFRLYEHGCDLGYYHSCGSGAWLYRYHQDVLLPHPVRAISMAERGCAAGYAHSCKMLFELADVQQDHGYKSRPELEASICPQVPRACE